MNLRKISVVGLASALLVGLLGIGGTSAVAFDADYPTVTGKVTLKGKAVADVGVRLFEPNGSSFYATTDATGTYTTSWLEPGTFVAVVENWYFDGETYGNREFLTTYSGNTVREPDASTMTVGDGETKTVNIALVSGATVKGKVVNAKGKPVAGATVSVSNQTRSGYSYVTTDAKGTYVAHGLATGKVAVWAYTGDTSFGPSGTVSAKATQGKTVTAKTLKLKAPAIGTITAKVKNLKKGDGVYAYDTKLKFSTYVGQATKSTLKVKAKLPVGTYRLVVAGTNTASKAVSVKKGKTAKFGTFKAPKKRTKVTGKIKGSNGKPLAGARVSVVDSYGTYLAAATTNAKGKYSVSGVVKGKYTVDVADVAQKHAVSTVSVTVKKGKNAKKNVKLSKGYKVTGTMKYAGKAVEGVDVYAGGAWATTNAKGKFTLNHLAKGKHVLSAYDSYTGGYLNASKSVTVKKNLKWNVKLKK